MNAKHVELWRRLEQFQLDSPEAALPFSARLARENNWSPAHTQRVIAEYKRFAFLAVAAGHPVSPPEDVDQAWHLHLTYSQNYWKVFCPEILGQPLHHQPTKGGSDEREKFGDWYRQTLESYRGLFGEEPPRDIWPAPEEREREKHNFIRVDRERHWVIPKPRLARRPRLAAKAVALALLAVGGGLAMTNGANPFDWRGPDFLGFYLILCAACFAVAAWLRWKLRQPVELPADDLSDLDPYAMAYLNGGKILAVNTAIANLANQNLLKIEAKEKRLRSFGTISRESHLLERMIHSATNKPDGAIIGDVRTAAKPAVEMIADQLKQRGLVVADEQARPAIWFPLMVALLAPAAAAAKVFIGLSRGKPVATLITLGVVSVIVLLLGFARRPLRSRWGDARLQELQKRYSTLRHLQRKAESLPPLEFATAIGLFGLVALEGTPLQDLRKSLQPPSSSSGCGSSCGGGCGGGCGGCGGD